MDKYIVKQLQLTTRFRDIDLSTFKPTTVYVASNTKTPHLTRRSLLAVDALYDDTDGLLLYINGKTVSELERHRVFMEPGSKIITTFGDFTCDTEIVVQKDRHAEGVKWTGRLAENHFIYAIPDTAA